MGRDGEVWGETGRSGERQGGLGRDGGGSVVRQ